MRCFYCNSDNKVKAGFVKGKQRYKCKDCKSLFTVAQKSTAYSKDVKRLALQLYLEGNGFNAIGRMLGVSHVAVLKWIRKYGKQAEALRSNEQIAVVEIDEMHSYIRRKKTISGYGLLLIDMGKDSSTSYWVKGIGKPARDCGAKSKTSK